MGGVRKVQKTALREFVRSTHREAELRAQADWHLKNIDYNKQHGHDTMYDDVQLRFLRNQMSRLKTYQNALLKNVDPKVMARGSARVNVLLSGKQKVKDSEFMRKFLEKELSNQKDVYDAMNDPNYEKPTTEEEKKFWRQ